MFSNICWYCHYLCLFMPNYKYNVDYWIWLIIESVHLTTIRDLVGKILLKCSKTFHLPSLANCPTAQPCSSHACSFFGLEQYCQMLTLFPKHLINYELLLSCQYLIANSVDSLHWYYKLDQLFEIYLFYSLTWS